MKVLIGYWSESGKRFCYLDDKQAHPDRTADYTIPVYAVPGGEDSFNDDSEVNKKLDTILSVLREGMVDNTDEQFTDVFRWVYALIVHHAREYYRTACMKDARDFNWNSLGATSKSTFMHKARDKFGIPHNQFLEIVRNGKIELDDLWEGKSLNDTYVESEEK